MILSNTIVHSILGNIVGEKGFIQTIWTNQIGTLDCNDHDLNLYGNIVINGSIRKLNAQFANVDQNIYIKGNATILGTQINCCLKSDIIHCEVIYAKELWNNNVNVEATHRQIRTDIKDLQHDIQEIKNNLTNINREIKSLKFIGKY
jgi:hypothetical protein